MTDNTTKPVDEYCGLTPLAALDVLIDLRSYKAAFGLSVPNRFLIFWRMCNDDTRTWRACSNSKLVGGAWSPTPEAALESAGLDPKLLDALRKQPATEPSDDHPRGELDGETTQEDAPAPSIRAIGPGWIEATTLPARASDLGGKIMLPVCRVTPIEWRNKPVVLDGDNEWTVAGTYAELRAAIVDAINWRGGSEGRDLSAALHSAAGKEESSPFDGLPELMLQFGLVVHEAEVRTDEHGRRTLFVSTVSKPDGARVVAAHEALIAHAKRHGVDAHLSWNNAPRP